MTVHSNSLSHSCPFCGSLLFPEETPKYGLCSNLKCRSYTFIPGNKVIHRTREELGIGTIIESRTLAFSSEILSNRSKINQHKNNWDYSDFFSKTNQKLDKSSESEQKYTVEFTAYLEKSVYSEDIVHKLWEIGQKIKFKQKIQTQQNIKYKKIIGEIINRNLVHPTGIIHYEILYGDGLSRDLEETEIIEELSNPMEEFLRGNLDSQEQFLLRFWSNQIHDLYTSNHLKIVTNSRLSLLPHQISVSHHLLEQGNARYILADEVGLGKTIEAGIYIKELIVRKLAQRILIIAPASLVGQWEFEMENKFNIKFDRLTSKVLKKIEINYHTGNFYSRNFGRDIKFITCTLQFARLLQCANILTKLEWDVVIFDEAHHLRRYLSNTSKEQYRATLAYKLAERLSAKTKSLLLLTATPIQLHSFDLFSLIQLLNPFEWVNFEDFELDRKNIPLLNVIVRNLRNFTRINAYERNALIPQIQNFNLKYSYGEIERRIKYESFRDKLIPELENNHFLSKYVIRNRRRIAFPNRKIRRIPKVIRIKLTRDEMDTYNKIHLYLARIYSENFESGPSGIGFVMVILQKLLTSSVPAVLKSLKKRIIYLKENEPVLLKLSEEQESDREFTADQSSLDVAWGLEDFDLEDRIVFQTRRRKAKKKKKRRLNIKDHIKILEEFVNDLESLTYDSKASELVKIVTQILSKNPNEKIIIFTQFKQTLFYLSKLIEDKGFKVAQFHGDFNEKQKNASVSHFRHNIPILLSTEIGGEGRNFQFCHIIVNYDLPWNPMRLEQRIGRLDRFGQTKNVLIYNFYIENTVEASIILAITDRIHLFEESIGALEPILGSLEGEITDLVLKKDEDPLKFRVDDVVLKTSDKIDEIYAKLEDLILDKRSFQYDYISNELDRPELLTGIDMLAFLDVFAQYSQFNLKYRNDYPNTHLSIRPSQKVDESGVWHLDLTEPLRTKLRIENRVYEGVFNLDLARREEEYEFFALGHPIIMELSDWCLKDDFGGFASIIYLKGPKLGKLFMKPYGVRLKQDEVSVMQQVLRHETGLNLFLFEIEFIGIIVEKTIVPVFITDNGVILSVLGEIISRPHMLQDLIEFHPEELGISQFSDISEISQLGLSEEILQNCFKLAQQSTKERIQARAKELTEKNRQKFNDTYSKILKTASYKKKFAETQVKSSELNLRAKKLKLPTERQKINVEKLEDTRKKQKRLEYFTKLEQDVLYYKNEVSRWKDILETMEFDVPAQLKRLKKYKKLFINAQFRGYARIYLV
ncbi:MAG: DEAD/DEAH box helicase [Promethearchaeota archaeon]